MKKKASLGLVKKKIVYYSCIYTWKALLDFYAAFVRQNEIGTTPWKYDPADLEVPLLSKHVKQEFKTPAVWFCGALIFSRSLCQMKRENQSHEDYQ